jgi:tRNA dimethylallyltransferase
MKKIFVLIGPTASGKSSKSIEIAKKLNLSIVNFDSRQFWKNIKYLNASPVDYFGVDHYLYDSLENNETPSLGWFVQELQKINKPILLVGGTIFYIRCLMNGVPLVQTDQSIREYVENLQNPYEELIKIEKNSTINSNDKYRVNRRLEFLLQTGTTFENYHHKYKPELYIIKIIPNEKVAFENIRKRTHETFDLSVKEIEQLQFNENFKTIIGYEDCWNFINKKTNYEETTENIIQKTIKYYKYQIKFLRQIKHNVILNNPERMGFEPTIPDMSITI